MPERPIARLVTEPRVGRARRSITACSRWPRTALVATTAPRLQESPATTLPPRPTVEPVTVRRHGLVPGSITACSRRLRTAQVVITAVRPSENPRVTFRLGLPIASAATRQRRGCRPGSITPRSSSPTSVQPVTAARSHLRTPARPTTFLTRP